MFFLKGNIDPKSLPFTSNLDRRRDSFCLVTITVRTRSLQLQRETESLTVQHSSDFLIDYYLPGNNETKKTLISTAVLDVQ